MGNKQRTTRKQKSTRVVESNKHTLFATFTSVVWSSNINLTSPTLPLSTAARSSCILSWLCEEAYSVEGSHNHHLESNTSTTTTTIHIAQVMHVHHMDSCHWEQDQCGMVFHGADRKVQSITQFSNIDSISSAGGCPYLYSRHCLSMEQFNLYRPHCNYPSSNHRGPASLVTVCEDHYNNGGAIKGVET